MDKSNKKYHIRKIAFFFGFAWSMVGLIAGILFPRIYMVPLLFSSWVLFGSVGHQSWANAYLTIIYNSPHVYIPLLVIEGVVFAIGCVIFLLGLMTLVKSRLQGEKIIKSGIYW